MMSSPVWLSRIALDAMHVELIREYGGMFGIRDDNLIESALARPQNKWAYGEEDLAVLAAAYGFGLARNHGYVDGNKRIAFVSMGVFLYQNGFLLDAPEADAVTIINEVAAGEHLEEALADWIRTKIRPREKSV